MIVLDTNVISEFMRPRPSERVGRWLDAQPTPSVWTTSVTVFEIRYGLNLLPESRRRCGLEQAFDRLLNEILAGRILDFDASAARVAADIAADRKRRGETSATQDLQITGIAAARRATLATRNVKDFVNHRVAVVNPWAG